ncbi:hypothetical protein ACHAWF_001591, partial [Thalassiosira exigua]
MGMGVEMANNNRTGRCRWRVGMSIRAKGMSGKWLFSVLIFLLLGRSCSFRLYGVTAIRQSHGRPSFRPHLPRQRRWHGEMSDPSGMALSLSTSNESSSRSALCAKMEADGEVDDRWTPLSLLAKILLPFQILILIYLLLLLPSGLALGTWCGAWAMGSLPYEYILFFSTLILPRAYRFGSFARPNKISDPTQTEEEKSTKKRGPSIFELALFISSLVGAHWTASYRHARGFGDAIVARKNNPKGAVALGLLLALRLMGLGLVTLSGWHLRKSYDRVARPDTLVQTGPYAIVRHPIYTAYRLLFGSTLLSLRVCGPCAVLLGAATLFFSHRMDSEEQLL